MYLGMYLIFATIISVINFNKFIFQVDTNYFWGILSISLIIFGIIAIILHFHWNNYSTDRNSTFLVKSVFWSVSFSLIICATVSLLVFELGI